MTVFKAVAPHFTPALTMPGLQLHLLQDLFEIGILKFITQLPLCGE